MKGRKLYVMPVTTAVEVASSLPSAPRTPRCLRTLTTGPWSARIVSQASVRIRYVTKKGPMMKSSRTFFQRPPRKAIQYASG